MPKRKHGLPRVEHLRLAPAKVRFLSIEPLLEDLGEIDLSGITWVIVGGESGPGARPMKREWVISIRRQCREQRVPFFFKQWGGCARLRTVGCLMGALMMSIRNGFFDLSLIERIALHGLRNSVGACRLRPLQWGDSIFALGCRALHGLDARRSTSGQK
jgi:hypothetical protein